MGHVVSLYAATFGFVYMAFAVAGFPVTGFSGWLQADTGAYLVWFRLNPTQNLIHFVLGTALMWATADSAAAARIASLVVGAALVGWGILGFWLTGAPDLNVVAVNHAGNLLHLGSGVLGVLAGLSPFRQAPASA